MLGGAGVGVGGRWATAASGKLSAIMINNRVFFMI